MQSAQIRKNIKRLRNAKGLTQKEMAEALFMDERTYSNFERGIKKSIDVKMLFAISEILGTDVIRLITDSNAEKGGDILLAERLQEVVGEINELKEILLSELKEMRKEIQMGKTA